MIIWWYCPGTTNNEIITAKIKSTWNCSHSVSVEDLHVASSLVQAGLLTSVKGMRLYDINIRGEEISQLTLPTFDDTVRLWRLSGDISQLLPLISCRQLRIYNTNLSSNDTDESLVNCLNTNVSQLQLGDITVDISVLTQYNGTGECDYVQCYGHRYRGQVTQWAHNMGWKVKDVGHYEITITRN